MALRSAVLPSWRPVRGVLTTAIVVAFVVVWTVSLRPQFLGGPTAVIVVSGTSMEPGLHSGDLVLVHRRPSYRAGDVVAYRVPSGNVGEGRVVIHRITGGSAAAGFVLRGDNRTTNDQWRPKPADIVGRHWVDLPTSNRLLAGLRTPVGIAALAAIFAFVLIAFGGSRSPTPR